MRLEAVDVSFRHGRRPILDSVNLTIDGGEVLALLGPNGAGKTTLLRLLAGDIRPDRGHIQLDGRPLDSFEPRALAIRRAVLAQSTHLTFPFTAFEVTLMGRHPHLAPAGETERDRHAATVALRRADAHAYADTPYTVLSGGEQQRVNVARALAQDAPVLLLDEPTAHLDPRHQHEVLQVARELAAEGCAVLAVLHDVNLAATYADRVALLADGRLLDQGTPWQVLTPERLRNVFGLRFAVARHPQLGVPLLAPFIERREHVSDDCAHAHPA